MTFFIKNRIGVRPSLRDFSTATMGKQETNGTTSDDVTASRKKGQNISSKNCFVLPAVSFLHFRHQCFELHHPRASSSVGFAHFAFQHLHAVAVHGHVVAGFFTVGTVAAVNENFPIWDCQSYEIQKKIEQKKDVSPTTTKNLCVQKLSWSCYQSKLKHHHNCNKKVWVHGCTVPQKPSLAALLNTVKESSSIDNTNMFDTYRRG